MNNLNPIIGITLGGFQVFNELTYIPLKGLTFIFGPNSAGKSSIQDAIEIARILQSSDRLFSEPGGGISDEDFNKIISSARISPNNTFSESAEIHIYLRKKTSINLEKVIAIAAEKKYRKSNLSYPVEIEDRWIGSTDYQYEQLIDGQSILKVNVGKLQINTEHPLFRSIECDIDFRDLAAKNTDMISYHDGYLNISIHLEGFKITGAGIQASGDNWLRYSKFNFDGPNVNEGILNAIRHLSLFIGYLMKFTNGASNFHWTNVEASRTIPKSTDLTYYLPKFDLYKPDFSIPSFSKDGRYKNLAKSLVTSYIVDLNPSSKLSPLHSNFGRIDRTLLSKEVNRILSEHLFLEKGYRVGFEYRVILDEMESTTLAFTKTLTLDSFDFLIKLHLCDTDNRKLSFEDVGSGIGYVLPVLCAIYDKDDFGFSSCSESYEESNGVVSMLKHPGYRDGDHLGVVHSACFIQQPELHLHPALQAALGDVFIEGSAAGNQLLIETHSEHLLLRVLKRIRQTYQLENISSDLKLNADDVCILYFQPMPDSTTKVKRLRISESGEFMDRWPGGFFPERDRELLDE